MSDHERPPVLVRKPKLIEIFNGAQCRGYSWAQTHVDLEIHVKLAKRAKYDDVDVILTANRICVQLSHPDTVKFRSDPGLPKETLVEGEFEHPIDVESAYWLIQNDVPTIVIYIDKREEMWWKQLLMGEQVTEAGPREYSVPMDYLAEGSRMAIDKLLTEQRRRFKIQKEEDDLSPV